jgi:hypothetical protein
MVPWFLGLHIRYWGDEIEVYWQIDLGETGPKFDGFQIMLSSNIGHLIDKHLGSNPLGIHLR